MSRRAIDLPTCKSFLSLSNSAMDEKSALPTPIIIIDNGNVEAFMIADLVSSKSLIAPSVIIRRIKYFWLS
jgi:hypothetical protein